MIQCFCGNLGSVVGFFFGGTGVFTRLISAIRSISTDFKGTTYKLELRAMLKLGFICPKCQDRSDTRSAFPCLDLVYPAEGRRRKVI